MAAHGTLGEALRAQGKTDEAIAEITAKLKLDSKFAPAFNSRGFTYAAKQDYERAITDYNEAIRLDPEFAAAFFNRGFAYGAKQDYDRAIDDYNEAIRLNPKFALAFTGRGRAYAAKQDDDRAFADYNEAIRLGPKFAPAFNSRGFAYAANEAIRLNPKFALAFTNRGRAYAAKQDYDRAIADYDEAVRLAPDSAYPELWLYLARTRSGAQSAELETNAKNLKQPDWPYPVVELFLGRRTPEATLAAATKPNDRCEAQFYIGEWHLLRGDHPKAIAALNAAVDRYLPEIIRRIPFRPS